VTDQETMLDLALTLESTAAQTYVYSAGGLTTPSLRQAIMSIGGVEARHMSVIYGFQETVQVPFPFMPKRDRVPEKAYIKPDGPLTPTTPPPTSSASATTIAAPGGTQVLGTGG
jgi:rubrerythrin